MSIALIAIGLWLAVSLLVVALCHAAAVGDRQVEGHLRAPRVGPGRFRRRRR